MSQSDSIRVLYMEDDRGLARLFQKRLERSGYTVEIASDGETGLEMAASHSYHLLVVDHKMPRKNGLEVIRSLAAQGGLRPTIMVTGAGDETVAVEAMKLGASDYILKDVENRYLDLMPSVIDQALGNQRLVQEKRQAEEALQRARDELEHRVIERTAELAAANELLRMEIAGRTAAQEDLRKSEERYRSLVENINLGVTLVDVEYTVVMMNAALGKMLGASWEECVGQKCYRVFRGVERPCAFCPGTKAMATGNGAETETDGLRMDGTRFRERLQAFPLQGANGIATGFITVAEDITERLRLEEQLRHAVKMEAVGRLAGGVAHDFNNILTAIIGYANMLLQQHAGDGTTRERLLQISRAGDRAAALTRQLLAFSRKQILNEQVMDINARITDFEKILRRLIGEDIEFVTLLDPRLDRVKADPNQVEQILLNLVVNARDAMPEGGRLTIETLNVEIGPEFQCQDRDIPSGRYATLSVTDTGHGMDAETLSHVFEPFFTTKERGKGTGLGLSTVYGIVKQHYGEIRMQSKPGSGTIFRVYLPRVQGAPVTLSMPEDMEAHEQGEETVLVVEDEPMVNQLACDVLEMLGYTVLRASHPEEAMRISSSRDGLIHLLVTDVVMPGIDGRTLYNLLSRMRPEMKVLYMSGYAEDSIIHRGVMGEGVHFLDKPFTPDRLAGKVREVLDRDLE